MKTFTCPYDYVHGLNGDRYRGTIEADSPEELRKFMQDELDASGGALSPDTFTSPHLLEPLAKTAASPIEVLSGLVDEANAKLKAAGIEEVAVPAELAAVLSEVKK